MPQYIRHLESVLNELSFSPHHCQSSKKSDSTTATHVSSAKAHIQQAEDIIHTTSDLETSESPELNRLQLIQCQLENSLVPKNRRRYNILTQILSLKTHLISPACCYKYLQQMSCISLPHFNTLEKLYSSFGLENEFFSFFRQATHSFSIEQKHVILQMDEIHVKPDISYKGGKIIGPNNPTKTVFAIMVSSLEKMVLHCPSIAMCIFICREDIYHCQILYSRC